MALFFARTYVVPTWLLFFGLVFVFSPPTGAATSLLLLMGGGLVAPVLITFLVRRRSRPVCNPGHRGFSNKRTLSP